MDDSVIKVLRRNGSWTKGESVVSKNKPKVNLSKNTDEDFSIDKNFGILAEEIKKRMMLKKKSQSIENSKGNKKDYITTDAKKELLPLLKNIEALTNQRDNYLKKINLIDEELESVKCNIISIKESYEKNISKLRSNINFFEQSISLINNIKGKE